MGRTVISENGRFEWDEDKDELNKKDHFEEKTYHEWRKNFIT